MVPVDQTDALRLGVRPHVLEPEVPVKQSVGPAELGKRAGPLVTFLGEALEPCEQPFAGSAPRALAGAGDDGAHGRDCVAHAGVVESDAVVLAPKATFWENRILGESRMDGGHQSNGGLDHTRRGERIFDCRITEVLVQMPDGPALSLRGNPHEGGGDMSEPDRGKPALQRELVAVRDWSSESLGHE